MEILIGLLCSVITFACIYSSAIKKEKAIIELKEIIESMDDKVTDIILSRIEGFDKRIRSLEEAVTTIKTKIAGRAALYSALSSGFIVGLVKIAEIIITKS
jgi:hypothetical protein